VEDVHVDVHMDVDMLLPEGISESRGEARVRNALVSILVFACCVLIGKAKASAGVNTETDRIVAHRVNLRVHDGDFVMGLVNRWIIKSMYMRFWCLVQWHFVASFNEGINQSIVVIYSTTRYDCVVSWESLLGFNNC